MAKRIRTRLSALCLIAAAACGDSSSTPLPSPEMPANPTGNTAPEDPAVDAPDAGTVQSYLLTEWVDGLVKERSNDSADPDTVDDKMIIDTDDPTAFDKYL